jgi:glycerol kinase
MSLIVFFFCPLLIARGIITGMTLATEKKHIARALLEGLSWQVREVIESMTADLLTAGIPLVGTRDDDEKSLPPLRVDGGVSMSNELLQLLSDATGREVQRPINIETTALGAAIAAGVGAGVWPATRASFDVGSIVLQQLEGSVGQYTTFKPSISDSQRATQFAAWKDAVKLSYATRTPSEEAGAH